MVFPLASSAHLLEIEETHPLLLFIDPIKEDSKNDIKKFSRKLNVPLSYFYKDSFGSISKKFFKGKMAFPTIVGIEGKRFIFRYNGIDDETIAEIKSVL